MLRDRFSLKVYNFWYPYNKLCIFVMCLSVIDLKINIRIPCHMNLDNSIAQHFHILIGCNEDQFEVNIETRIAYLWRVYCEIALTMNIHVTPTWTILFTMTQHFQILSEFNKCQIKVNIETRTWNLFGWDIKMTF